MQSNSNRVIENQTVGYKYQLRSRIFRDFLRGSAPLQRIIKNNFFKITGLNENAEFNIRIQDASIVHELDEFENYFVESQEKQFKKYFDEELYEGREYLKMFEKSMKFGIFQMSYRGSTQRIISMLSFRLNQQIRVRQIQHQKSFEQNEKLLRMQIEQKRQLQSFLNQQFGQLEEEVELSGQSQIVDEEEKLLEEQYRERNESQRQID